ncbi:MAG TPA: hypothetical protein VKP61_08840 [Candidatus Acidoferrum sp.]|nr:hypothetical protein [Candidatus Acidoferrum sp.]
MAWYDTVLSNTLGVAYRSYTGNVDPWTLQQLRDEASVSNVNALGPDATDAEKAVAAAQAANGVDSYLKSINAHPDQSTAGPRIPFFGQIGSVEFLAKLEKLVYGTIAVGALIGLFYFSQKYGSSIKKTFEKK